MAAYAAKRQPTPDDRQTRSRVSHGEQRAGRLSSGLAAVSMGTHPHGDYFVMELTAKDSALTGPALMVSNWRWADDERA